MDKIEDKIKIEGISLSRQNQIALLLAIKHLEGFILGVNPQTEECLRVNATLIDTMKHIILGNFHE